MLQIDTIANRSRLILVIRNNHHSDGPDYREHIPVPGPRGPVTWHVSAASGPIVSV